VENLAIVRPTFMAGPPRIFEKIHAKVVQTAQEQGGVKVKAFTWAFGVGRQLSRARIQGRKPGLAVRAQHALADRLVLSKVRQALGGRISLHDALAAGGGRRAGPPARWHTGPRSQSVCKGSP
jgi:long-chain acyl-CoA synthetase